MSAKTLNEKVSENFQSSDHHTNNEAVSEETQGKNKQNIKNKHSDFRIIGLMPALLVLGSVLLFVSNAAYHLSEKQTETKSIVSVNPQEILIEQYNNKKACINWILEHSSKISRDMAIDIFETAMSTGHGLILISLASIESSINPFAVSKKGAIGLNQIMPNIWVEELKKNKIIKEKRDLFNYKANLKASHYILMKYYKETGSWKKTLKKYVGANSEPYVEKVLANCGELYLLSKSK